MVRGCAGGVPIHPCYRVVGVRRTWSLHGIPTTSPARTLLDCAPDLSTGELAAAMELAQIKGLVTESHALIARIAETRVRREQPYAASVGQ